MFNELNWIPLFLEHMYRSSIPIRDQREQLQITLILYQRQILRFITDPLVFKIEIFIVLFLRKTQKEAGLLV